MNDFKDVSDRYRQQMLDLYKRYPKPSPQDDNVPIVPDTPTTLQEPTPIDCSNEDSNTSIEDRYPEPILPPFIYQGQPDDSPNTLPQDSPPQYGYLKVVATSAEGTIPLADVSVIVSQNVAQRHEILYTLLTDASGETPVVELPTPPKVLSESPNDTVKPYAQYDVSTYLHGYFQVTNSRVPIFSGVTSIQRVNMVPLPSYTDERKTINLTIEESEPDL